MKINASLIRSICGDLIIADSVTREENYGWLDIVSIPQKPTSPGGSRLFFASYSDCNGWTEKFNREPYAEKVCKENGWDLVSEKSIPSGVSGFHVISIEKVVSRIYSHFLRSMSELVVIGVTGSVGKTTTVSLLEQIIAAGRKSVIRFYSKRLSPLSVMCHFLNRVDEKTEVVVMEYSAYHRDHVSQLAELLPPSIVFITNIYDTHINQNPNMFKCREEILCSKMRIKTKLTRKAYINSEFTNLAGYNRLVGWKLFTPQNPQFVANNLPPTKRTAEMLVVAKIISEELGIPSNVFNQVFKNFAPQENRIITVLSRGKRIFFHGETSGGSRLLSWLETYDGSLPFMFIDSVDFADEDENGFTHLLEKVFRSTKTLVLDTPATRNKIKVPASFVAQEEFVRRLISAQGYIVYHKALSVRDKDFSPSDYIKKILG